MGCYMLWQFQRVLKLLTQPDLKRRDAIKNLTLATSALAITGTSCNPQKSQEEKFSLKGKVKHSACRWCYSKMPLEQLAEYAQELGMESIELLNPDEWDVMLKRGLTCAISNGSELGITKGFNDPQYHAQLLADFKAIIPRAADKGIGQIICFSGNRNGLSDEEGLENCAVGLEPIIKMAEEYDVRIVMELLNSKVNHKDYQCDKTPWGVELVEKIGSPNFKLLYDIYHMQIMEGDVIATIKKYQDYICHYHTGGVPGRNEIDETQELYYPAIIKAIVDTGYKGFLGQEFIPTWDDKMKALKHGVMTCDV